MFSLPPSHVSLLPFLLPSSHPLPSPYPSPLPPHFLPKILNYGRIYGAGRPFIELLLRTFNPSLTDEEVQEKAGALYTTTKGIKM